MKLSLFFQDPSEQGIAPPDQPLVVLGKRKRKGIETFAITHEAKRPLLEYKGGSGVKLGDIEQSIKHKVVFHSSFRTFVLLQLINSSEVKWQMILEHYIAYVLTDLAL